MLSLACFVVAASALAGLIVKVILDKTDNDKEITWTEYAIALLVISLVIAPASIYAGWAMAKNSKMTFHEYWNGWEMGTQWNRITCTRDGPCVHEYDCDPYQVSYSCNCDKDGCDTCWRTEYHDCPYATEEWTFIVNTSLGDYTIRSHGFPDNPQIWRAGKAIPGNVPCGIPEFWAAAKERVDSGNPGPATKRMSYDNYILASERTILKEYGGDIEWYLEAKMLPPVQSGIRDFYYADKMYFIGWSPDNAGGWQNALMRLNAALGTELQGDLHLIIVHDPHNELGNADRYLLTLKAYWQDASVWSRDTISKNSIIVIIGSDGEKAAWARATTGMPLGNERMCIAIRDELRDAPLTPEMLVGTVSGEFYIKKYDDGREKLKVRGNHGNGILERILWGLDNPQTKFVRISMSGDDADDVGSGFSYLKREIEPSPLQKKWIVIAAFIFSLFAWCAVALMGDRYPNRWGR
jgi:hypothetical protein